MAQSVSATEVKVSAIASTNSGETAFYVIDRGSSGGFVVMSADDRLEPVLVIAPTGKFDANPGTPLYDILFKDVQQRMSIADGKGAPPSEKWRALLASNGSGGASPAGGIDTSDMEDLRVGPLVQSKWSQSYEYFYDDENGWEAKAVYNYYTPPYSAGSVNNYVCGCVATAGSQIMRYHRFPTSSVTPVTHTCYVNGTATSKTTKGGTFDWENMPLTPADMDSISDAECRAIGKLTYDVGVAVYMSWTSGGSGAYGTDLVSAFKGVFGYKNAIYWQQSQQTTLSDSAIKNALLANFDAKCPVELSISNSGRSNFHSIVADGYGYVGGTLYVHLNLGWAGSYDAWYNLPSIGADHGFSLIDGVVYNIFPGEKGDLITGRVLDSAGNAVVGASVQAFDGSSVSATATTDSAGIYALHLVVGGAGKEYVVEASAAGMDAASKTVYLTASVPHDYYSYEYGVIGNSWGNDLVLTASVGGEVPSPPVSVSASDGTSTAEVRVSWGASSGAAYYKVFRSASNSAAAAQCIAPSVTALSYDDASAEVGATYYYWVKAVNSAGESDFSASDSGWKAYAVPDAPQNVSASKGTSTAGVVVSWSAVASATSYEVWRSESSSSASATRIANGLTATTYTDTSAAVGTTYTYWVKAANQGGTSGWSNSDTGYRKMAAPAAPTGVAASDGLSSTEIVVTWNASATAESYSVYRGTSSTSSSASQIASGLTATSYSDSSALAGTTYYYWVKATNAGGTSGFSASDTGYLAAITGPASVTASDGDYSGYVRISWQASQSATSYEVWRGTANAYSQAQRIASPSVTSYNDTSATPGMRYWYWVKAVTSAGTSAFSASDTGYRPLSVPTDVAASNGREDGVRVTWSAVTGATKYEVGRAAAGSAAKIGEATSLAYTDSSAVPGVSYAYFVRAVASACTGAWSASATGSRLVPTPSDLTASDGTYTDRILVSWPALAGATEYELMRADEDDIAYAETIATTSSTAFSDTSAEYGLVYYYFLRAKFAAGTSRWSASEAGWRAFPAPQNVSASDGTNTGRITVGWDAIEGVTLYQIWRYSSGAKRNELIGTSTSASYNDSKNVVPGTSYKYYVKAVFPTGMSGLSLPDTGYLKSSAPAVVASDGTSTSTINLSWNVITGAKAYYIYRGTSSSSADASLIATLSMLEGAYADSSVESGVLYYYWMKTSTALDTSDFGSSDTGYIALPGVATVRATDGTYSDKVQVSWTAVSGAASYEIWRGASDETSSASRIARNITELTYDDTTVNPGTKNWYWIRPVDGGGVGLWGACDSGWRKIPAPSDISATTNQTDGVKVSWKGNTTGVSFEIKRSLSSDFSLAETVATVSEKSNYTDVTTVPGYRYWYWVSAYSELNTSAWSESAMGYRAVAAPATVSATDGTSLDAVTVTWTSATSAKRYEIWRSTTTKTDDAELIGVTNKLVWVDSSVEPGILYYYWIKSISSLDTSVFSNRDAGYASTPSPTGVTATDGFATNFVRVSWTGAQGALNYAVWRAETNEVTAAAQVVTGVTALEYDDKSATPGKPYWYWVRPVSAAGPGVFAGPDRGYASLTAPIGIAATSNDATRVMVSWRRTNGAVSYEIFRAETNDVAFATNEVFATATALNYADTNAYPAVKYWYWVRAVAEADISPLGGPADGFRLLSVPTGVVASDGAFDEFVKVSWNETTGAASYEIWRAENSTSTSAASLLAGVTNSLEYLDTNATAGVSYTYWLKAVSELHTTALSANDKGWRSLPAPATVTASDGTTSDGVVVEWSAVEGAVKYEVWRKADNESATNCISSSVKAPVCTYTDTSAKAGALYWYWVRTVAATTGSGVFSTPDDGFRAVTAPTNLKATYGTSYDYVRVTWGVAAGAESYEVCRTATNELYSATTNYYSVTGKTTTFDDTNAVPGIIYSYSVRTIAPLNTSDYAGPVEGFRKFLNATNIAASDGTSLDAVDISWTSPTGAIRCQVWRSTRSGVSSATNKIATVVGSFYSDTNALHGVKYWYWVSAVADVEGDKGSANDDGWRALIVPGNVQATDGDSTGHTRITWTESTDATSYKILRGNSDDVGTMSVIATLNASAGFAYEDKSGVAGSNYWYSVRAVGTGGESESGSPDSGYKALDATSASVSATDGTLSGQVRVTWNKVNGATHYQVYRADSDDGQKTACSGWQTMTSFVDTSCRGGVRYWYYIKAAVDGTGARASAFSGGNEGYTNEDGTGVNALDLGGGISWPVTDNGDGTATTNAIAFASVEGGKLTFPGVSGEIGSTAAVHALVKTSLDSNAIYTTPATLTIISEGTGELDLSSVWGTRPSLFVIGITTTPGEVLP